MLAGLEKRHPGRRVTVGSTATRMASNGRTYTRSMATAVNRHHPLARARA